MCAVLYSDKLFFFILIVQPDLIPLFSDGDDIGEDFAMYMKPYSLKSLSPLPQQIPVQKCKQFVLGDTWIIGLKVSNARPR